MARTSATKPTPTDLDTARAAYTRLLRETRGRSLNSAEILKLNAARAAFLAAQEAALAAEAAVRRERSAPPKFTLTRPRQADF